MRSPVSETIIKSWQPYRSTSHGTCLLLFCATMQNNSDTKEQVAPTVVNIKKARTCDYLLANVRVAVSSAAPVPGRT